MAEESTNSARAERLKERIYLTFTGLAVILALSGRGEATPYEALVTLAVTMAGTLLAMLVAEATSHLVVHARLMSKTELLQAIRVARGALAAVVLPIVFLVLAEAGIWSIQRALRASAIALIAALVVIGYLAARRVPLRWWQRLMVLAGEAALGMAVVGLELLAHH